MKKRVVGLGFFDGVHIGHGALLLRVREIAEEKGIIPSAMTYSHHPSEVLGGEKAKLLSTPGERIELIRSLYGIEDVTVKEFTKEYAALSPREFVEEILISEMSATHVVAGFDFRFGKCGEGDANLLSKLCAERGIGCDIIDEVKLGGEKVSSSRIRELVRRGDVEEASLLLGHNHCIIAEVTHGDARGRKMFFPTVNQELSENAEVPKFGVYASRVTVRGKEYRAITNIGTRPTVSDATAPRAETHILDFSGELYGEVLKTELVKFIREERKFGSLRELSEQIAKDVELARLVKV